ncbi:PEP/pyruvate-binding domain-containing protein [Gordonia sp. FQ]|uniref:PEP/pyruvate-binding domain-containing protein n=1 Tax=Gordonia sp. FQ TaxID=3446634 RepID=UPI003F87E5FD
MSAHDSVRENRYIRFFDTTLEPSIELLGGKCASLTTMTTAGMPVPPGFTVTTKAYTDFLEETGLHARISEAIARLDPHDMATIEEKSAKIRDAICSHAAPDHIRDAFRNAYEEFQSAFATEVPVAVRSSATAEDLPTASFAGQQDTYLWVSGVDAVIAKLRSCWASLYTSRAILYRIKHNIPDEGLAIAVAIQKMVNARASGVAITMNPTTGDRSKITIDASWGVGEMVVSGQVTPDNLLVDKVMLTVLSHTIGDKHAELIPDGTNGELTEREVEPERRERLCLTPEEITQIAAMAKRAEKHYQCPQDIEWALDADLPDGQNLLLLQSRPETVHSSKTPATASSPSASTGFSLAGLTANLTNRTQK